VDIPENLLHRYIERRRKDYENCSQWVKEESFNDLERIGHQLKGNGKTFGFEELSKIGLVLEEAAKHKDIEKLEIVLNDFNTWLKKIFS
jgi:HPt (histidine-containing phosphotransfer) domain-containing protein